MLTVVQGAPCSGKSTYVRTHAQPGDLIVDFDLLAQALGSPDSHRHSQAIRRVAVMARRAAIEEAITQHARGHRAWIVDGNPQSRYIQDYHNHNALIVTLRVPKAELHRRARGTRPHIWHRLIDEWSEPELAIGSREW